MAASIGCLLSLFGAMYCGATISDPVARHIPISERPYAPPQCASPMRLPLWRYAHLFDHPHIHRLKLTLACYAACLPPARPARRTSIVFLEADGTLFERMPSRYYPHGSLSLHLVGSTTVFPEHWIAQIEDHLTDRTSMFSYYSRCNF